MGGNYASTKGVKRSEMEEGIPNSSYNSSHNNNNNMNNDFN